MHFSTRNLWFLSVLAARGIIASPLQHPERSGDRDVVGVTPPPVNNSELDQRDLANVTKRALKVIEITPSPLKDDDQKRNDLEARSYPYKTDHCGVNGGTWMPLVPKNSQENGFNDACSAFCSHFDGTVVPGGGQVAALVQSTGTEVLRLTSGAIGHFQGEIYCRKGNTCTIVAATCTEYLKAIGAPGSQCYGPKNKDTKGGRNDMAGSYWDAIPKEGEQQ